MSVKNKTEMDPADLVVLERGGSTVLSRLSEVEYLPEFPESEFPAHATTNSFRMMNSDERLALKMDVREKGIQRPVIVWLEKVEKKGQEPYYRKWLIDGRNRAEEFRDMLSEKHVMPDGSLPAIPVQYFRGEADEVYDFVRGGLNQRHMDPGQRAATAVLLDAEHDKILYKKDRRKSGDDLQVRAQKAGCSRTYYWNCKQLAEAGHMDLLRAVRDGAMKITEALSEKKARKAQLTKTAGEDQEGSAAEQGGGGEGEEARPEVKVLDGEKQPVPEEWKRFFVLRDGVHEADKVLRALSLNLQAFEGHPGAHHIPLQHILDLIDEVGKALKDGQPHVVCPEDKGGCGGDGKNYNPEVKGKTCGLCGGPGYLSSALYKALKRTAKKAKKSEGESNGHSHGGSNGDGGTEAHSESEEPAAV